VAEHGDVAGARTERGSTVVEFLATMLLMLAAFFVLAQLATWAWARNVAVSAAHEGARLAGEAGRPLVDGESQTRLLLKDGLGSAGSRFAVAAQQEGSTIAVVAHGSAPSIVPFLPRVVINVRATAFDEDHLFE
jgi:hypothetical protein